MSGERAEPRFRILDRERVHDGFFQLDVLTPDATSASSAAGPGRCGASCSCSARPWPCCPTTRSGPRRPGRAVPYRLHRPAGRALADRGGGRLVEPGERAGGGGGARGARGDAGSRSAGSSSSAATMRAPAAPPSGSTSSWPRSSRRRAGGVFGVAHEDEDIRTLVLPATEAFAMVGRRPDHRRQQRHPAPVAAAAPRPAAAGVAPCRGVSRLRRGRRSR